MGFETATSKTDFFVILGGLGLHIQFLGCNKIWLILPTVLGIRTLL